MNKNQALLSTAGIAVLIGLSSWTADVAAFQKWQANGGQTPDSFWSIAPHMWSGALAMAGIAAAISLGVYLLTALLIRNRRKALTIGAMVQAVPAFAYAVLMALSAT